MSREQWELICESLGVLVYAYEKAHPGEKLQNITAAQLMIWSQEQLALSDSNLKLLQRLKIQ